MTGSYWGCSLLCPGCDSCGTYLAPDAVIREPAADVVKVEPKREWDVEFCMSYMDTFKRIGDDSARYMREAETHWLDTYLTAVAKSPVKAGQMVTLEDVYTETIKGVDRIALDNNFIYHDERQRYNVVDAAMLGWRAVVQDNSPICSAVPAQNTYVHKTQGGTWVGSTGYWDFVKAPCTYCGRNDPTRRMVCLQCDMFDYAHYATSTCQSMPECYGLQAIASLKMTPCGHPYSHECGLCMKEKPIVHLVSNVTHCKGCGNESNYARNHHMALCWDCAERGR